MPNEKLEAIHIRALGAVEVTGISGKTRRKIDVRHTADELLRSIAAHPEGVGADDVQRYFPTRNKRRVHDAASQLRNALQPFGLTLTNGRPAYRILTAEQEPVTVFTDLKGLSESGAVLARMLGQNWSEGPPLGTQLIDDLQVLDEIVGNWPVDIGRTERHARSVILGKLDDTDRRRRLIDLDDEVRYERALRAVALSEQTKSHPAQTRAKRAIADCASGAADAPRRLRELSDRVAAITYALRENDQSSTDVFLAAPMEAAENYSEGRTQAERVIEALQEYCGVGDVFFAGQTITDTNRFEDPAVGLGRNMPHLRRASKFLMIYPNRAPSGVLAEAGLALALGAPSVYFVRDRTDLPWVLRDPSAANVDGLAPVRIIVYRDDAHMLNQIQSNGEHLFPQSRN